MIVGCGKTFLISFIIDHLQSLTAELIGTEYIYLYFDSHAERRPSHKQILATMLLQLLNHKRDKGTIANEAIAQLGYSVGPVDAAGSETLKNLLLRVLRLSKKVFIVVDGVDNCEEDAQQSLFDTVRMLYTNVPVLRLLLSTRSDVSAIAELGVTPSILHIDKVKTTPDIEAYVRARAAGDNRDFVVEDDGLAERIAAKAGGMFLLAREHMDWLRGIQQYGDFKRNVESPPAIAYKSFNSIVERIKVEAELESNAGIARHVFTYLMHGNGDLTVPHLQQSYAAALVEDLSNTGQHRKLRLEDYIMSKDSFISACGGLVAVDRETRVVSVVHDAVHTCVRGCEMIPPNAHTTIAKHCLIYLLSHLGSDFPEDLSDSLEVSSDDLDLGIDSQQTHRPQSFLRYAATHWDSHLRKAIKLSEDDNDKALRLATEFLKDTSKVTGISRFSSKLVNTEVKVGPDKISGLHAAILLDLPVLAERLVKLGCDVNATCSAGRTPLHLAARLRDLKLVKVLLEAGAKANIRDAQGDTPVHLTVMSDYSNESEHSGQRELLIALLHSPDARAALNIPNNNGDRPFSWALHHAPEPIVHLLSSHQLPAPPAEPLNFQTWSPLREVMESVTSQQEMKSIISLLLVAGVDPDTTMQDGWTALTDAIWHRRKDIVDLLLQHGADANTEGHMYGPPLRLSIKLDQPAITQLLVQHANVGHESKSGCPHLVYAARKQKNYHVWLLLDAGAPPNLQDDKGWTALHYAVRSGNEPLAWLLMSKGANPGVQSNDQQSPLHIAIESRRVSMVHLLCMPWSGPGKDAAEERSSPAQAAVLEMRDGQGVSPLHRAVLVNDIHIVEALYRFGGQQYLDVRDHLGATALHHAVTLNWDEGMGEIAFFLTGIGARLDARDNMKRTPLMWAARKGGRNFVLLLLQRLDNRDDQDVDGQTAQDFARAGGYDDVVSCIKFYKAEVSLVPSIVTKIYDVLVGDD
ncbi:ankyrin repeat-containing domain protein [Podospora aff. communis PSN243]|uniref:Ankyrin repeat-containing domain protein n=1 Tax=Podospora aff. communis PSN243 TaxID=3040156 RepID=A0AAV9G1N7_9PEZI|nr:ankyrin repeat-containing domain protein [Podospora aff. communis PSN243]